MGNTISSNQPTDIKSLSSHIDDIAVHYILKQNTIDLLRLTDKEYYDNLIVLVGNLFEKRLSDLEIGSINQRIFPETIKDAVFDLLPTNGKIKDVMISNISKFYIKIMMIFSAIVATIDPQYSYEDETGKKQLFYLKDLKSYKQIPKNVMPVVHQLTNPMNLCRKRISILRNKIDSTDPDFITINPGEKLCSTDSTSHLTDEIGIKELDLLYYDVFDPDSKTWKSRSEKMQEKYDEDLNKFYTIFTGKSEMPENIKSFKDIELFDFRSIEYCRDSLFTHDFIIPKDNELILRYKEQVDLLEQSTTLYRNQLLENMKKIFLTKIENDNMSYTIEPSLTLQAITEIEEETRNTIIDLYTNCEQYFIRALLIFEELYDNQSKNMNESRMNNIENRNRPLYKENMININTNMEQMPRLSTNNGLNIGVQTRPSNLEQNFMPSAQPVYIKSSTEITPPEMPQVSQVIPEVTPVTQQVTPLGTLPITTQVSQPVTSEVNPITPEVTPPVSQQVTPPVSQEVTPPVSQEVTPLVTPQVTPEVTPLVNQQVTPQVTQEVSPLSAPEITPQVPSEISQQSQTNPPQEIIQNNESQKLQTINIGSTTDANPALDKNTFAITQENINPETKPIEPSVPAQPQQAQPSAPAQPQQAQPEQKPGLMDSIKKIWS
jgi:hypothetical protein